MRRAEYFGAGKFLMENAYSYKSREPDIACRRVGDVSVVRSGAGLPFRGVVHEGSVFLHLDAANAGLRSSAVLAWGDRFIEVTMWSRSWLVSNLQEAA